MTQPVLTKDTILMDAKADKRKGQYTVYNSYKQRLGLVCNSSYEYQEACKQLATELRL